MPFVLFFGYSVENLLSVQKFPAILANDFGKRFSGHTPKNRKMNTENSLHLLAKIVLKKVCGHNEHCLREMLSFDTISAEERALFEEISHLFLTKDCFFTHYNEDGYLNIGIRTKTPLIAERFDRDFDGYYFKYWKINNFGAISY